MKTYGDLLRSFQQASVQYDQRLSSLERKIEILTKRRERLLRERPHFIDELVRPIAAAIAARYLPGYDAELLGPFGLACQVSIHFWKKDPDPGVERFESPNLYSITFVEAGEDGIAVRDMSTDTGAFPHGTIGEINGMNQPSVEIPAGATAEWFMKFFR